MTVRCGQFRYFIVSEETWGRSIFLPGRTFKAVTLREPALRHELIIFIVSTKGAGRTIYGEEFMEQGRTDII